MLFSFHPRFRVAFGFPAFAVGIMVLLREWIGVILVFILLRRERELVGVVADQRSWSPLKFCQKLPMLNNPRVLEMV